MAASLLQGIYLAQYLRSPYATFPIADAALYDRWARDLLSGMPDRPFHMAPLYAYVLAGFYGLVGPSLKALAAFQSVLWLFNGLLVGALARRVTTANGSLVAFCLYALSAPFSFYAVRAETVTVALTLILLALHLLARDLWLAGGVVLGLAALARPELLLFVPLAAGWSWRAVRSLRAPLLLVLATSAGVAPATLHNLRANGRFVLVSWSGGEVLYQGNAPGARGTITRLPGLSGDPLRQEAESIETASRETGRSLAPDEVQAYWTRRTRAALLERPGDALALLARKALLVASGRDLPLSYSLDLEKERTTPALRLAFVTTPLLLALATLGVEPRERRVDLLLLFGAAQVAALLVFFVATRLKLPLVAVLIPLAARGLVALPDVLRRRSPRLLVPVALLAGVYVHDAGLDVSLAESHSNLAAAYASRHETGKALAEYDLALAANPRNAEIWFNRGSLLAEERPAEAVGAFQRALEVRPDHTASLNGLGLVSLRLGDLAGAERLFRRAVDVSPSYALARFNLGQVLRRRGLPKEALVEIEKGLALEARPEAHLLAGDLARDTGDPAGACAHWRAARAGGAAVSAAAGERLARASCPE